MEEPLHTENKDIRNEGISLPYALRRFEEIYMLSIPQDTYWGGWDACHNNNDGLRWQSDVLKCMGDKTLVSTVIGLLQIYLNDQPFLPCFILWRVWIAYWIIKTSSVLCLSGTKLTYVAPTSLFVRGLRQFMIILVKTLYTVLQRLMDLNWESTKGFSTIGIKTISILFNSCKGSSLLK